MIKTEKLTKKFGDFMALAAVNCTINDGEIYGIVGSNGAGKSTFLRLLSGIYRASTGQVTIDGQNVFDNPRVKSAMIFVPDELYFFPHADLMRMADFYAALYPRFSRARLVELIAQFALSPRAPLTSFSKGMKRQAAVILALASGAQYLLFDETFDGLDPVMRNLLKKLIAEEVADKRTTIVMTSHSLRELEDACGQLALLHQGGIIFQSEVQKLQTTRFKVQIVFKEIPPRELFADCEIHAFKQSGRLTTFITSGDREVVTLRLAAKNPLLIDILPLSLEEVFTHEMAAIGYHLPLPN